MRTFIDDSFTLPPQSTVMNASVTFTFRSLITCGNMAAVTIHGR